MAKRIVKLNDLLNTTVYNYDASQISLYDVIQTYIIKYKELKNQIDNYPINDKLQEITKDNKYCVYIDNILLKDISVYLKKSNINSKVSYSFDCHNRCNIICNYSNYNEDDYQIEEVNKYESIIGNLLKDYINLAHYFNNTCDKSHGEICSVNTFFSTILVNDEALVFFPDSSYIDVKLNEFKEFVYDYSNVDIFLQAGLHEKQESLLKNIYVNIDDCPLFIKDDLYAKRLNELEGVSKKEERKEKTFCNVLKRRKI